MLKLAEWFNTSHVIKAYYIKKLLTFLRLSLLNV